MAKTGMLITAYCDTDIKQVALLNLCQQVRSRPDLFIVVASHTPVSEAVQELVDYVIYDKNNVADSRPYSHGVAECMLIEQGLLAMQYYSIGWTYKLTYDCVLNDPSVLDDWASKDKKLVTCMWGDVPLGTLAFYTDVGWFLDTFTFFHSIEHMFERSNMLEQAWLRDLALLDPKMKSLYIYPDMRKDMFRIYDTPNKVDMFYKQYK